MEAAGLGLAGVASLELCLRYGKSLYELCQTYRHAKTEVAERALILQNQWIIIAAKLEFSNAVFNALEENHQKVQRETLQVLESKLHIATQDIERFKFDGAHSALQVNFERFKYLAVKKRLDKTIKDLQLWQTSYDSSWWLIMMISKPIIDQELNRTSTKNKVLSNAKKVRDVIATSSSSSPRKNTIFLPEKELASATFIEIPMTSAKRIYIPRFNAYFILDPITHIAGGGRGVSRNDLRDIGQKLSLPNLMNFGLLEFRGAVAYEGSNYDVVFNTAKQDVTPRSLRECLLTRTNPGLSERLSLARQLTRSICHVHMLKYVHKNIRPETLLVYGETEVSQSESLFLVGFDSIRLADGRTELIGDVSPEKNLYRHPSRQGLRPEEDYIMQHDMFSLGICLLELGLWRSLIRYDPSTSEPRTLLPTVIDEFNGKSPRDIKELLVETATSQLPSAIGDKYTNVTVNCLTCLDQDNKDFGNHIEFEDDDGIEIGVRYVEKILLELDEIVL